MLKAHGIIENIKILRTGEKNGNKWKLYSVKINNFYYSGFGNDNNDSFCHFHIGEDVLIEYENEEKYGAIYHNIKSIKPYRPENEQFYKKYLKQQ